MSSSSSIPIKCFTCGNVIGNKYAYYLERVHQLKNEKRQKGGGSAHKDGDEYKSNDTDDIIAAYNSSCPEELIYLQFSNNGSNIKKTPEGLAMDELDLVKNCCRRHFLTHV